ncbi:DUF418 domain-containing protein [Nibrella viscosa]|uniref:DUF418 domain-containing protein n=1 Tax=Nibrella viscosa TaxID=1084524 RepID=UPI0031E712C6
MQVYISQWWLSDFRYGPLEWLWRSATYGKLQPMTRQPAVGHAYRRFISLPN